VRPVVLVTGFGPFPGAPENPSQALVEALADAGAGELECELRKAVLPTRYDAAREAALRLHRRYKPDIAIHFGFSLKAMGFTLEQVAENRLTPGRPDAGGARPERGRVRDVGPLACASTLPLKPIRAALERRGLPVALSDDAGAYVCNLVFYAAAARRRQVMAGFVHVPLLAEMRVGPSQRPRAGGDFATLTRSDLSEGARLIVETCVAEWRRLAKKSRPRGAGGPVASREEMPKEGHRR
jgi:pyroglutamyl-peptidase